MTKRFLRSLVILLIALTAAFVFVSDDVRDYDAAYVRLETLKESSERLATHQVRSAIYDLLLTYSQKSGNPDRSAVPTSPTRVSLSTCILLC